MHLARPPLLHGCNALANARAAFLWAGFSEVSHYPHLASYIDCLSADAQAMFRRWNTRSKLQQARTADALRAAAGLRPRCSGGISNYRAALDALHPSGRVASRAYSTACLSKLARRVYSLRCGKWGLWWERGGETDSEAERAQGRAR